MPSMLTENKDGEVPEEPKIVRKSDEITLSPVRAANANPITPAPGEGGQGQNGPKKTKAGETPQRIRARKNADIRGFFGDGKRVPIDLNKADTAVGEGGGALPSATAG